MGDTDEERETLKTGCMDSISLYCVENFILPNPIDNLLPRRMHQDYEASSYHNFYTLSNFVRTSLKT